MPRCVQHSGLESVVAICGKAYCERCRDGIVAARARVDRHVEPKECFVWYKSNNNWQPIEGTGCAHWVGHQLNICNGPTGERCLAGIALRVPSLIVGRSRIADLAQVKVNNIYVTPPGNHVGLVVRIMPSPRPGGQPTIIIRHDSSGQHQVSDNEFASYFHGRGTFYR